LFSRAAFGGRTPSLKNLSARFLGRYKREQEVKSERFLKRVVRELAVGTGTFTNELNEQN
jgi:hypothetical protein